MRRLRTFCIGLLLMLGFCPLVPGTLPAGAEPHATVASPSKLLSVEERFHRDPQTGVISDFQTGRKWREGPNKPTSWNSAEAWARSLGAGWRIPTCGELKTLFVKPLRGRKGGACRNMPREFAIPEEVTMIWANRRNLNSAWQVSFLNGGDCWEQDNLSFAHGCRALAISSDK